MAKRTWFLLILAVVARLVSMWWLKADVYFDVIPRSLLGRAVMLQPVWLDIAVPVMMIILLWPRRSTGTLTTRAVLKGIADALGLLIFPLLTGLALYVYVHQWSISVQVEWASVMRWIHFVLGFLAINLFMDALPVKNRWGRRLIGFVAGLALAVTQDITFGMSPTDFIILGVLSGVGTTQALTALAFRPLFRESPWRATLAALVVGGLTCFIVVAVESQTFFTLVLPALALIIGAATIRSAKSWPRWAALAALIVVSLGLSLVLPRIVSPEFAATLAENVEQPVTSLQVGTITVRYGESEVRDVAIAMARVLESANKVSQEEFGVSPQVDELIIWGISPGGFHAEFPHRIVGNLASEQQIKLSLDSAFLNAPNPSIHFPDPVNAILHEYSHLYGVVPYMSWIMGPEEEGWATYAATRLSLRLYQKYGPGLWVRPYDYAAWAKAITQSNLNGHPVVWSHADEFGGFRLWRALGERDGEPALFLKRWELTQRNFARSLLMRNEPDAARRMAVGMGESEFASRGSATPVVLSDVIAPNDWEAAMDWLAVMKPDQARALYAARAQRLIDPAVHVPSPYPWLADLLATIVTIVLALAAYLFKPREEVANAQVDSYIGTTH